MTEINCIIQDDVSVPYGQLAVSGASAGQRNQGILAEAPDGIIVRFRFAPPEEGVIGIIKIPICSVRSASEKVYQQIRHKHSRPSEAFAYLVEEKYDDSWPEIDEIMADPELWIDTFEHQLFDFLRLIFKQPDNETRYLIHAVSSNCRFDSKCLQLKLCLLEKSTSD